MQVWSKARAGDPQAVGVILEQLRPRVERIGAYYARRTGAERDELVQEGLVAMLEGLAGLDAHVANPAGQLVRLARWRMLDWVRWRRRRTGLPLGCEQAVVDRHLAQACERIDVGDFLSRLKPRPAQVVGGLMDGWNWREVAAQMGCSSANLAYHVRQIRLAYERGAVGRRECA